MFTSGASGIEIATDLGWSPADLRTRQIIQGPTTLDVSRAMVAGKSATLFARVVQKNGHDPLDSAALYAYHSNVDWGLLAEDAGVRVFNSHRLVEGRWLSFPQISWDDLPDSMLMLSALSPAGLLSGAIEQVAADLPTPTTILQPIDDRLVDQLDKWRDEAVRYSRHAEGVDERLQTLFAQMFVLRAVEDRGLAPSIPSLLGVRNGADAVNQRLGRRSSRKQRTRSEASFSPWTGSVPSRPTWSLVLCTTFIFPVRCPHRTQGMTSLGSRPTS